MLVMCIFHGHSIKFVNKSKMDFVDDYLRNYGKRIHKMYPIRDSITIEIIDENSTESQNLDCNDKYTPMQSLSKKAAITRGINTINEKIIITSNYNEPPCSIETFFNDEELFALLSHEIGHIIASYTNHDCGGVEEELYADDCASKLGLRDAMLSSVKIMLEHHENSPERIFDDLNVPNKERRKFFEERIKALSNS